MINTTPKANTFYKFSDLIASPQIKARWEKVRKFFFLRESTYDMTHRCNIHCNGCYYYKGEKQHTEENRDSAVWRKLMISEKERGITYVVLAGAEPSLVPELCQVCYEEMPLGTIATNGLRRIPDNINYKIHISVWGNDTTSFQIRNAKNMLKRQIENYKGDPRAIWVYTFTCNNITEAPSVIRELAKNNCKATFNIFSAPVRYQGDLIHTNKSLQLTNKVMVELMAQYPKHVIYSFYNIMAHTHPLGLHALYGCSYPRQNNSTDVGLGRTFRQYRTDLSWDRSASCCVPDTDCADCRHYAAGSAIVTARLFRHAVDPDTFNAWLDYVDTYLAVWVMGYEKGSNLISKQVPPPGFDLPPT